MMAPQGLTAFQMPLRPLRTWRRCDIWQLRMAAGGAAFFFGAAFAALVR